MEDRGWKVDHLEIRNWDLDFHAWNAPASSSQGGEKVAAHFVNHLCQRLAVDVLHRVVVYAPRAADGVDRNDVRMVQPGGGAGFVREPLELPRVEDSCERQHLERHAAVERNLSRFIHDPHPAAPDLADDTEIPQ